MDPVRGLLQMVTEMGESALQRGLQVAAGLGAADLDPTELPTRLAGMADDAVGQGRANTDMIVSLVRSEVDKAVGRMGFVREEELAAVRRHLARLEAALTAAGAMVAAPVTAARTSTPAQSKSPGGSSDSAKSGGDSSEAASVTKPAKTSSKKPAKKPAKPSAKKPAKTSSKKPAKKPAKKPVTPSALGDS